MTVSAARRLLANLNVLCSGPPAFQAGLSKELCEKIVCEMSGQYSTFVLSENIYGLQHLLQSAYSRPGTQPGRFSETWFLHGATQPCKVQQRRQEAAVGGGVEGI